MKKLSLIFIAVVLMNTTIQAQENSIQKQIIELHKGSKKLRDSVGVLIKECDLSIEKTTDSIAVEKLSKRLTYLWSIFDASLREQVKNDLDFALLHPSSLLCAKLLLGTIQKQEGLGFYEKYEEVYQNFSTEIKTSEEGKLLAVKLKYFKQSNIGSVAPDFTVKDINNTTLTLSEFRGKKYILLDFWASWCAPCIEDQRYLKNIYGKFSKNDFEIISISRDTDIEKWKKSILKHKTYIWKHVCIVSDLNSCDAIIEEREKSIDVNYFVSSIPHYVLVDKNGIIMGKWKNSGELNMQQLEQKLAETFEN